ncbi:MdtA/MuxA family multidrug efflux RND transporter periplasmic adaptor subunit [Zoogloea sp.]|uniref:MdtA/MuxA family multidrug efflux RND transporter periplasmic adaptor subunit n=1 Tax=Zoogloea sp. TaxID=49181 RepID=UPI0035B157AC
MKKKVIWTSIAVLLAATAGTATYYRSGEAAETKKAEAGPRGDGPRGEGPRGKGGRNRDFGNRPVPVQTAASRAGDIDVNVNAIGTVTALNTVTIKPRVDGQLQKIAFGDGQQVKAGDLLAEIDPRPFKAAFDQASGQLQRDEALLANARLDLERYRGLLAKDSIARQQVDAQEAQVRQLEGTVLADRALVDTARLNLGFTKVTAPVAGTLGLRQVDAGNMVRAADASGLVVLTQTQPITVLFSIPSTNLPAVQAQLKKGKGLSVEAWDRDGRTKLAGGHLVSTDNLIDTSTGTVKLKAQFDNKDGALFPNQFVSARLRVDTRHDAVLVPSAAILKGNQGSFVYVINEQDKTASMRPVVTGPGTADTVAIESGLSVGEKIVVDGVDRLRDGAPVELSSPEGRQGGGRHRGEGARNEAKQGTDHGGDGERRNERKKPA